MVEGEAVEVVDGLVVEVGEMVEEAVVVGDMGRSSTSLTVLVETSADFLY